MKKNDLINIYYDPLTQKSIEGKAKLISKIDEDEFFITWKVRFIYSSLGHKLDKGEPIVIRKILKEGF